MQPDDLLLIVLLPRPIDLDRAAEGLYRVPLARAPAVLATARALAFYQTSAFGPARWQISWMAPVRRLESATRRVLVPDEPDHPRADRPYVAARLGRLRAIEPPKRSGRGRRLLFVPVRWGRFLAAPDLDSLLKPAPRPVADAPRYRLLRQQLEAEQGLHDPRRPHQPRLFDPPGAVDSDAGAGE